MRRAPFFLHLPMSFFPSSFPPPFSVLADDFFFFVPLLASAFPFENGKEPALRLSPARGELCAQSQGA